MGILPRFGHRENKSHHRVVNHAWTSIHGRIAGTLLSLWTGEYSPRGRGSFPVVWTTLMIRKKFEEVIMVYLARQ